MWALHIVVGVVMTLGAWFTYQGKIFNAVLVYLVVDVCWIITAVYSFEIISFTFLLIGVTLTVLAAMRMRAGVLRRNL